MKKLMRVLLYTSVLISLYAFSGGIWGALFAETGRYRLSFRIDPASTMVIGWDQQSGSGAVVYYGETDYGQNYAAYPFNHGTDRSVSTKGMHNRFSRLTDLSPDTIYYFVIKDSNSVSPRMWFKTAPNIRSEFSFIGGGDSRNNRTLRKNANRMVSKLRPLFVLFAGDFTESDTSNQWKNWMDDWQLTKGSNGRMFPIIVARGNHERNNDILLNLFDIPGSKDYYALTFGADQLRIYTLNSEISAGGDQRRWLENDLLDNRDVLWKVAQYHKPMRPHTSRKPEGNDEYSNWAALFYSEKMNLVIESDSHTVKYTYPIKPDIGPGSDEGFKLDSKGTVYIGEGGWGAPLRSNNDNKDWTRASGRFNQFSWVHVRPETLEIRTIKVDTSLDADEVDDANPLHIPSGLDIWSPVDGPVVTLFPITNGAPPSAGMVISRVSSGTDDAEENKDGGMYLNSSDLELVWDGRRGNQMVGMRFQNMAVPPGAVIKKAYIQFKVDETDYRTGIKNIYGENTENADRFRNLTNNISGRPYTSASVFWNPPVWNKRGVAGVEQRTPDLSEIIQEITDRPGWSSGNPIVIIVQGLGERVAESYEGDSDGAPLLFVEYEVPK